MSAALKLANEQAKLPVKVLYVNTPDLPMAAWCVPLMVQVAPICAHLVQPDGASDAAKALLLPSANAAMINALRFMVCLQCFLSIRATDLPLSHAGHFCERLTFSVRACGWYPCIPLYATIDKNDKLCAAGCLCLNF